MTFKQHIRNRFLQFLKHYFNPLTKKIAQSSHGPFAIVRHIGRQSGKKYETPIIVQSKDDSFIIELTYGPDVDWYKNVVAAGGCELLWHGKTYKINQIDPIDSKLGRAAFPFPLRLIIRMLAMKYFVKLTIQQE